MATWTGGELVEAARRGDPGAVERLLYQARPDLRRIARRACRGPEDAEDAVQHALWALQRRIGALRTASALAAWLFRVVTRECRRLLGLRGPPAAPVSLDDLAAAPVPAALRHDLARAIEALAEPYRAVLILRDVEELTAPEAAAVLGITPEALKSRLHRARAEVRETLMAGGYLSGHDL